ncbi:MAG: hypothetical protein COX70_03230 [Flavobacteriales bacterium CG_4_10_14_0_2_um_filter_32_8]|nr:MAG: hypothetical protein COX70_03230 [Flavobacteriales bacterium CG_4_10_14_0_2_um_filter_32_8]PJB13745.1 MAG: hypothetical protein CO118_12260 [Flavobacteriales bacterium CG_4_9_14_3_um_filter_32_8]
MILNRNISSGLVKVIGISNVIIFLFFSTISLFAQSNFSRWDSVPVVIANNTLNYPWAGGLNNPQFSDIDLNGDGILDLFVFDRSGNRIITFLNGGTPNIIDYKHAPEYQTKFPEIRGWALLVDYNGDGKKDIYTSAYTGVKVYRNDYTVVNGLQFTLVDTLLLADGSFIFISEWDLPAIKDMDGDGDVDILTFEFSGALMEYYKNLSIETYGTPDSLLYTLQDSCWGKFEEAFGDCSVTLDTCGLGKTDKAFHAGSTTLALDLDCDNDMEVIIGDVTCTKAYMLTNGGNSTTAAMSNVDVVYPPDFPLDLHTFPSAFHVDVNNDGQRDLLAAGNALHVSENFTGSWYYENTNTDCSPYFSFVSNAFLQNGMIEVGEGANPVFFDYNSDSLQDLVIGNFGYYNFGSPYTSNLSLYENIGTATTPFFQLITRDYVNISSYGLLGVYPTFGDLDGDGDQDLLIGESEGNLYYFVNTATSGNPANFVLAAPFYKGIDVGRNSTPQLVDVNCDGLLDLLIGERDGTLNYYKNIGSKTVAEFTLIGNNIGGVDVKKVGDLTGYSSPFLTVLDSTGEFSLLVGSERGYIYFYKNIDSEMNGNFTLIDSLFLSLNVGDRASISGGDLNQNGTVELLIGNYGGGVELYHNSGSPTPIAVCPPPLPPPPPPFSIHIYPNPTSENLFVKILGTSQGDVVKIAIHNVIGQEIGSYSYQSSLENISIPINSFADGIYFCKLTVISGQGFLDISEMLKFSVIK